MPRNSVGIHRCNNLRANTWPGQDTLRIHVNADRKSIIRWLRQLEAAGYITRIPRGGDGSGRQSNAYALHFRTPGIVPTPPPADPPATPRAMSPSGPGKVPIPSPGQSPTAVLAKSPSGPGKVPLVTHEPLEDPSEEPSDTCRAPSARQAGSETGSTPGFDRFWAAWPAGQRKRGRKTALAAWKTHQLETKTDMIVADVLNRARNDEQWLRGFAPMPQTYLRGARWEDELTAPVEQRQTNATLKGILALEKFK